MTNEEAEYFKKSEVLEMQHELILFGHSKMIIDVSDIEQLPTYFAKADGDLIKIKVLFAREFEYANKDIDFAEGTDESEENYMRGYLGGLLCAYRLVFGKSYEESEESEEEE